MGFFLLDDNDNNQDTHDYDELASKVSNMIGDNSGFSTLVKMINAIVDQDMTNHNTPASEFDWGVDDDHPLWDPHGVQKSTIVFWAWKNQVRMVQFFSQKTGGLWYRVSGNFFFAILRWFDQYTKKRANPKIDPL